MKMDLELDKEDGGYTQDELAEMLRVYTTAKKIEADSTLMAMLKDYAKSKSKETEELFNPNESAAKPKSLDDLRDIKKKKDLEPVKDSPEEEETEA